jgi:hypothetical protein
MPYPASAATRKTGATKASSTPVVNAPGGRQYSRGVTNVVSTTPTTPTGPLAIIGRQYTIGRPPSEKPVPKAPSDPGAKANKTPAKMKFNLPHHSWSLTVRPKEMDASLSGNSDNGSTFHALRRARIWYYDSADNVGAYDSSGNITTLGQKSSSQINSSVTAANKKTAGKNIVEGTVDRDWGFQFLWNPESISTSMQRTDVVTPSAGDRLVAMTGVFPGQESISFSIVIDRTNDFACAKSLAPENIVNYWPTLTTMSKFYKHGYPSSPAKPETFEDKMYRLLTRGTQADIEYLLRAINGNGVGDYSWTNPIGRDSADIGYLQPTLLAVQFGPYNRTSTSYVGWIESIQITHQAFTENMIPIRSTIQLQMTCFANSGLIS